MYISAFSAFLTPHICFPRVFQPGASKRSHVKPTYACILNPESRLDITHKVAGYDMQPPLDGPAAAKYFPAGSNIRPLLSPADSGPMRVGVGRGK